MRYIENPSLMKKLRTAIESRKLIFITGATGYGKTRLMEEALKDIPYDYFSLKNDVTFQLVNEITVIDDFQYIIDHEELLREIIDISLSSHILIILSRSNPYSFFMDAAVKKGICEIKEADLALLKTSVHEILDSFIGYEMTEKVYSVSEGNPLGILLYYERLSSGTSFNKDTISINMNAYFDHLKNMVFDYIDPKVLYLMFQVSVVDSFTLDFAESVSLNPEAKSLLTKAMAYGNFMTLEKNTYTIRNVMLHALRERYHYYLSDTEYNEFRMNAGRYYESKGNMKKALEIYEECHSVSSVKRILMKNSFLNPAHGQFKELKKYYMMLSEDDIRSQPVLMSGMSMLESLILDVKKSEEYYHMLEEREKNSKGAEAKEIRGYIDYLDFALPHRNSMDIFKNMRSLREKSQDGRLFLQHFSLTAGCPSVIHGARDFSSIAMDFADILRIEGKSIESAMGKTYGKGILDVIEAECMYEAGYDEFLILKSLVPAKMSSDKHELENIFVLTRIEAYLALERGDKDTAKNIIKKFILEAETESPHLLNNAHALYTRILIYTDDEEEIKNWMETSPDEDETFFITDRMAAITKIYCYIYLKKYSSAYILLQKLRYYADLYERKYLLIEIYLLSAIIEYLTDRDYYMNLKEALLIASSLRLVRVVSNMGILVYEMIEKSESRLEELAMDPEYHSVLNKHLILMAERFPTLFNKEGYIIPSLSKTGVVILELQSKGYSLSDIAKKMSLNLETVRYHAKQNYKKLGSQGKAEAVAIGKRFGII